MIGTIRAALEAIAALPKILTEMKDSMTGMKNTVTEMKFNKIQEEMNEVIQRIPHGKDRDEMLALAERLNSVVSK